MAFRAPEAAFSGRMRANNYLIPKDLPQTEKERAEKKLLEIEDQYGPVIEGFPSWSPLVPQEKNSRNPVINPDERCGYRGLDHTICFAHAFITCPYGDGSDVFESVSTLQQDTSVATIEAELLDVEFYNPNATPILVSCQWSRELEDDNTIPKSLAIPLMLEQELPVWRWSEVAESWDTMLPYLLGQPHGRRSSLFVSQGTALAMKKIYTEMVASGMYGPLKTR